LVTAPKTSSHQQHQTAALANGKHLTNCTTKALKSFRIGESFLTTDMHYTYPEKNKQQFEPS